MGFSSFFTASSNSRAPAQAARAAGPVVPRAQHNICTIQHSSTNSVRIITSAPRVRCSCFPPPVEGREQLQGNSCPGCRDSCGRTRHHAAPHGARQDWSRQCSPLNRSRRRSCSSTSSRRCRRSRRRSCSLFEAEVCPPGSHRSRLAPRQDECRSRIQLQAGHAGPSCDE